jgi:hypothetical protein
MGGNAMTGEGTIMFSGFPAGGLEANITLENGQKWSFKGVMVGGSLKTSSMQVKGEFPGVGHMDGACTFSLSGGALGPGSFEVRWGDTKGEIGMVKGNYKGVNVAAGAGSGDWKCESAAIGERS